MIEKVMHIFLVVVLGVLVSAGIMALVTMFMTFTKVQFAELELLLDIRQAVQQGPQLPSLPSLPDLFDKLPWH